MCELCRERPATVTLIRAEQSYSAACVDCAADGDQELGHGPVAVTLHEKEGHDGRRLRDQSAARQRHGRLRDQAAPGGAGREARAAEEVAAASPGGGDRS